MMVITAIDDAGVWAAPCDDDGTPTGDAIVVGDLGWLRGTFGGGVGSRFDLADLAPEGEA